MRRGLYHRYRRKGRGAGWPAPPPRHPLQNSFRETSHASNYFRRPSAVSSAPTPPPGGGDDHQPFKRRLRMFRFRMMFKAVALTVVSFALAAVAQAQAPHTFVSALTGDDANPCSPSEPCRTIKQALSQTQAKG